jgi:hypothetical protein
MSSGTATLGRLDSGGPEALAALAARARGGLPTVVESSSNPSNRSDTSGSAASNSEAGSTFTAGTSQAATAATSVTSAPNVLVVNTYRVGLDPLQLAQVGRWLLAHVQHGAVDGDWLQATYGLWRQHVRNVMVNSQIRSIIAAANKGSEGSDKGEEEELSTIQEGSEDEEAAGSSSAGSTTVSSMIASSMTGTGTCVTALEEEDDEEDVVSELVPHGAAPVSCPPARLLAASVRTVPHSSTILNSICVPLHPLPEQLTSAPVACRPRHYTPLRYCHHESAVGCDYSMI